MFQTSDYRTGHITFCKLMLSYWSVNILKCKVILPNFHLFDRGMYDFYLHSNSPLHCLSLLSQKGKFLFSLDTMKWRHLCIFRVRRERKSSQWLLRDQLSSQNRNTTQINPDLSIIAMKLKTCCPRMLIKSKWQKYLSKIVCNNLITDGCN